MRSDHRQTTVVVVRIGVFAGCTEGQLAIVLHDDSLDSVGEIDGQVADLRH